jgi:hypothetical protein
MKLNRVIKIVGTGVNKNSKEVEKEDEEEISMQTELQLAIRELLHDYVSHCNQHGIDSRNAVSASMLTSAIMVAIEVGMSKQFVLDTISELWETVRLVSDKVNVGGMQ